MRIAFSGKRGEVVEELVHAMGIDALSGDEPPKGARCFDVRLMRDNERVVPVRHVASQGIGQLAVCE